MKKLLTLLVLCSGHLAGAQTAQQLENLTTFNRLYGYVKYFHPSDEAAALDWDKFAIYGCREIEKCKNAQELQKKLLELFLPVAPTIKVFSAKEGKSFDVSELTPMNTSSFKVVSWQHAGLGVGSTIPKSPYRSARANRKSAQSGGPGFCTIMTTMDATKYRSKAFKLTASIRLMEGPGTAHLWARVDKPNQKLGFFDNMENRPITTSEWKTYEINGTIDSDAERLAFGCFLKKTGKLQIDNLTISIQEGNVWKSIYANSFESDKLNVAPGSMSGGSPAGYKIVVADEQSSDGKNSVVIQGIAIEKDQGLLFQSHSKIGEYIKKDIGSGLTTIIPLAVYGDERFTYPQADAQKLAALKDQLTNITANPETDVYARAADIIITWNVFQHFYPYFKETKTDWSSAFNTAIKEAYANTSAKEFLMTLRKLTAQLNDGHVRVHNRAANEDFALPLEWEWVENKLVVTNVYDNSLSIKSGDVITHIDQKPADKYFQEDVNPYIAAATPGWLHHRAQTSAILGAQNSNVTLKVVDAQNKKKDVSLSRTMTVSAYYDQRAKKNAEPIRALADGIYYINLDNASMEQIESHLPEFAKAKALICDLRGYPNGNHELIGHLLPKNDTSKRWMRVPEIIYPDQENITGYSESGWELTPLEPHIKAKVFFILDGSAISYAESYMGFIEHYKLATIIGQPSAGTNGNVNTFSLPGDYRISWTGMKVVKHNGSQHHGVGILPDVYVQKTIRGVKENRDEFLEKAIELATQYKLNIRD